MVNMSELKVYRDPKDGLAYREFYEKSEADKVIAEKDAVIAGLKRENKRLEKEASCTFADGCLQLWQTKRKLRHQKYKRCLAMAMWCFEKSYSTTLVKYDKESGLLRNFYDWWGKRWLELAEKFKEAK